MSCSLVQEITKSPTLSIATEGPCCPPVVKVLPKGTFYNWLRSKGKLGGQHKIPRLSNDRSIVDELNKLENVHANLFVGQQKKAGSGLSQKEQKEMLDKFSSGKVRKE